MLRCSFLLLCSSSSSWSRLWSVDSGPSEEESSLLKLWLGQNSGSFRQIFIFSVSFFFQKNLILGSGTCRTWKSLGASVIMSARPWVAARFSLRSCWSGRPRLVFLRADLLREQKNLFHSSPFSPSAFSAFLNSNSGRPDSIPPQNDRNPRSF